MSNIILGNNSVIEALKAGRPINKIIIERNKHNNHLKDIFLMARQQKVTVQEAEAQVLEKIAEGQKHQGVLAYVSPVEYAEVDTIIALSKQGERQPLIVILEEVQDPHNFGAIIRSCEAAGVDGIIIPQRRSCPITEVVSKSSSGAIEYMPIARVGNLAQLIKKLKDSGFWIVAADMDGQSLWTSKINFDFPVALVIGGEDKGIGRLTKSECDYVVSVPMVGKVNSLNASVATAVLVFEIARKRASE
ncbi:MAG: 23S rRNA (guanosine(2251)-2'-O)-methyltransferase RlmB [Bacillota bacterium]